MAVRKFAISIPEDVMQEIDDAANARGVTRSRFISEVLRRTAKALTDADVTRRLDRLFADPSVTAEQRRTARAFRAPSNRGTEW
jgi:hypothetical protein